MPSIFHTLELIRQAPSMYLGSDSQQRGLQLRHLEMVINGYALALAEHGLKESGEDFMLGLQNHLERSKTWDMSQGPIAAIVHNMVSEAGAWDFFWQTVHDYEKSVGSSELSHALFKA